MKTKEFIGLVEKLGYEVLQFEKDVLVYDSVTSRGRASISKEREMALDINTDFYVLAKLCLEYAETPIEEREDVKKYVVVLPDIRNDGTHFYALVERHDGIGIGKIHKSHLEGLTESEIKRNYEYLWQFAKEVE